MLAKTLVLLLATVAATSSSLQHNWTYQHGALAAGNDLQKGNHTLAEAESICVSLPGCIGFTDHSSNAKSAAVEAIYFKKAPMNLNTDFAWSSYLLDYTPGQYPYPGPNWTHPRIHQSPDCLHRGGWHDMAGALTFKGEHHAFQGCPASGGWSHSVSSDLVRKTAISFLI